MSKPSIFSRDYEQRMKRRKLNVILFLLLLVCIGFFGGRYLLKNNNVKIFPDFSSQKQGAVKKDENKVENKSNDVKQGESNKTPSKSPSVLEYTYTLKNNKQIKLEYTVNGENKEFKGFKDENLDSIEYDISPNKKNVVFVDKADQSLIMGDIDGKFIDITKPNVTYSSGKKLTRKILETKQDYIWNAKPKFTSEGNIVYISNMPNSKPDTTLTLWVTKASADSTHKKVTKLSSDISIHNFEGFDAEGRLKLKTDDGYVYISKDGSKATK